MLKICGAAILAVALSVILKRRESSLAPYIEEIAAVTITVTVISTLVPAVNFIKNSVGGTDGNKLITSLLRACSVAVICQTVYNICKDHGENSLSYAVELAGNAEILVISLPYLEALLDQIFGVLGV